MIKVNIIALAALKEKYLRDAAEEYIKRIGAYCKLTVTELTPVRLPEKPSQSEIDAALEREADMILKKIPQGSTAVALCIEGSMPSSEQLAEFVGTQQNAGKEITFIIGSSYGLAESLKQKCKYRFSFSKMTFPHQLFRIMLLEQLYRSFKINSGGSYHK